MIIQKIVKNKGRDFNLSALILCVLIIPLSNDLGGCSLEQEGEDFYIVGADAVRKKLGSGRLFIPTLAISRSFNVSNSTSTHLSSSSVVIDTTEFSTLTIGSIAETINNASGMKGGYKVSHQAGTYDISGMDTVTLYLQWTGQSGVSSVVMKDILFS